MMAERSGNHPIAYTCAEKFLKSGSNLVYLRRRKQGMKIFPCLLDAKFIMSVALPSIKGLNAFLCKLSSCLT